jgi:hypothetical protein
MRTLKYLLVLLIAPICFAQGIPNCTLNFTLNAASHTSAVFPNNPPACDKWTLTVYHTGTPGTFSLLFQSAPPGLSSSTPGTWITYPGATGSGSANPVTSDSVNTFTNGNSATAFLRVLASGLSGTTVVYGQLQGSQTVISKGGGGSGGGAQTIAGTTNEIAVTGPGCTPTNTGTCTISIPTNPVLPGNASATGTFTAAGLISSESFSGNLILNGLTSGQVVLAVDDVAGTAIVYVMPSTNGTAGQFLEDSGSVTCPTLPAGSPSTCHQLVWTAGMITGGTCTNQAVTVISTTGVPTCTSLTPVFFAAFSADNILGNFTGSSAVPSTQAIPACANDGSHALVYPSHTLTCETVTGAGASGGGTSGWSGLPLTFISTTTQFAAPVGGALTSATESVVQLKASATATITNLQVTLSAALGVAATLAVTLRDGGSSMALTCTTTSGGSTCTDTTHSVNVTLGDLLSFQLVSAGTVTAGLPQIEISYAVGTSGVGLTGTPTNHGVVIGTGANNVNSTTAGSVGQVLTSNGASADPTFQAASGGFGPIVTPSYVQTAQTTTTNCPTFVDLATADTVTFSLSATTNIVLQYMAQVSDSAGNGELQNQVMVDGSLIAGTLQKCDQQGSNFIWTCPASYAASLGSGSHTIKVQHCVLTSGTGTWSNRLLTVMSTP